MIEDIVAEPGEAFAGALLLGEDEVATRDGAGEGPEAVGDVGLLERHMGRDPGRGADVQMALVVPHGARAHAGRLHVGRAADHRRVRRQGPAPGATSFLTGPRISMAPDQIGQLVALDAGHLQQLVVIDDVGGIAVVGDPVEQDRIEGGGEASGEAQVDVVLGIEEFVGLLVERPGGSSSSTGYDRAGPCPIARARRR